MTVMAFLKPATIRDVSRDQFAIIHPLDDVLEEKVDTSSLGRMAMTPSVKAWLLALRGYLALMILLVFYHVIDLAGALVPRTH
jgi:hypothetical protein